MIDKKNNTGMDNSGKRNSGNVNSGNFNSGDYNSGWFNTNEPKMRFFNKDSDITYSEFSKRKKVFSNLHICQWIDCEDLSDTKNMGGMLKTLSYYKEAWAEYWTTATEDEKNFFKTLPNFDEKIFEEITGIKINENKVKNCVQCGEEMKNSYGNKEWSAPFCENPECPNYGLLQIGIIYIK